MTAIPPLGHKCLNSSGFKVTSPLKAQLSTIPSMALLASCPRNRSYNSIKV